MFIQTALFAAAEASRAIMEVYKKPFYTDYKSDGSPVTVADKLADTIIREYLQPTGIPVISEESNLMPYESRKTWSKLWMVDPLDGTKEFVKGNGEFTVNIAMIENGKPVLGVITAPATGKGWIGVRGMGIYAIDNIYDLRLAADQKEFFRQLRTIEPASNASDVNNTIRFAVSLSHPDQQTEDLICHLKNTGNKVSRVPRGSSLKLCDIAIGMADAYPRFGPTKEWDIAAGQAILQVAGGEVVDMMNGNPLIYNKPDMLNPYFVARNENLPEEILSIIRQWHTNPQD
jgi:3'(2'), 5'-bisphosphate nucleotidase